MGLGRKAVHFCSFSVFPQGFHCLGYFPVSNPVSSAVADPFILLKITADLKELFFMCDIFVFY